MDHLWETKRNLLTVGWCWSVKSITLTPSITPVLSWLQWYVSENLAHWRISAYIAEIKVVRKNAQPTSSTHTLPWRWWHFKRTVQLLKLVDFAPMLGDIHYKNCYKGKWSHQHSDKAQYDAQTALVDAEITQTHGYFILQRHFATKTHDPSVSRLKYKQQSPLRCQLYIDGDLTCCDIQ